MQVGQSWLITRLVAPALFPSPSAHAFLPRNHNRSPASKAFEDEFNFSHDNVPEEERRRRESFLLQREAVQKAREQAPDSDEEIDGALERGGTDAEAEQEEREREREAAQQAAAQRDSIVSTEGHTGGGLGKGAYGYGWCGEWAFSALSGRGHLSSTTTMKPWLYSASQSTDSAHPHPHPHSCRHVQGVPGRNGRPRGGAGGAAAHHVGAGGGHRL